MSIDASLIEFCSPTLASLKAGSLFAFVPDDWQRFWAQVASLRAMLREKGLALRVVRCSAHRALCYLYRPAQLNALLEAPEARDFLRGEGYRGQQSGAILNELCVRLAKGGDFPHEIGLFLGYPLADVQGFIRNHGQNCLCSGCWKAYSNECEARRQFARLRKCQEVYRRLFARGRTLAQLTVAA